MSFNHPQDRHVHQKEKIEQDYRDAREHLSHQQSQIQAEEEGFGEARKNESAEERIARFEADAEQLLDRTGKEVRREHEKKRGG